MRPITTFEELGLMEEVLRKSERLAVVSYIRHEAGLLHPGGPERETLEGLADEIERGDHWTKSRLKERT